MIQMLFLNDIKRVLCRFEVYQFFGNHEWHILIVIFLFSFGLSLAGIDGQLKIMFFGIQTKTADYSVNWHGRLWLACKKSFWP